MKTTEVKNNRISNEEETVYRAAESILAIDGQTLKKSGMYDHWFVGKYYTYNIDTDEVYYPEVDIYEVVEHPEKYLKNNIKYLNNIEEDKVETAIKKLNSNNDYTDEYVLFRIYLKRNENIEAGLDADTDLDKIDLTLDYADCYKDRNIMKFSRSYIERYCNEHKDIL